MLVMLMVFSVWGVTILIYLKHGAPENKPLITFPKKKIKPGVIPLTEKREDETASQFDKDNR